MQQQVSGGYFGDTISDSPDVRHGLVSLYDMLPLTPTPPTFHLPNNTACGLTPFETLNEGDRVLFHLTMKS